MNAELLLQHFERLSEAPDAIERLRRFILDLAVRGKLVDQDQNDEPAAELIKRIQAEKARLVKEGKAKKLSLAQIDERDSPFMVPANWAWTRLGEIGDWGSGSTPPRGNSEYYGDDVTWLKSGELGDNIALASSEERITYLALEKCSFRVNQPGDVLIAMYGATIGKLAILAEQAVTNQAVCGCTPVPGVFNRYLFVFLLSRREDFQSQSEGGAQPNISKVKIVSSLFALPPTAEQHRIVAKVDELMALCDKLEAAKRGREQSRDQLVRASLQRLNQPDDEELFCEHAGFALNNLVRLTTRAEHIKQLRQTIFNLAVRGKLVPQVPNDEPAIALYRRLLAEIKSFAVEKGIAIPKVNPIAEEVVPFALPSGWMWSRLASLFKVITDGDHQPPPRAENGVAFLTIGNVTTGHLDFSNCRFVPQEYFDAIAPHRRPTKGDFLYTVVGATYGRPALVHTDRPFCVQRHIAILKPVSEIDFGYLHLLLSSPLIYEQATRSLTGTAQPTIPLRPLRNFLAPLPPLAEQHRIVAKVAALMALCDQLEAQLVSTDGDNGRLLEAVLHEALTTEALATAA